MWPGVSTLPDYKPTFPQWSRKDVGEAVPQLDLDGLDLLKQLLAYDSVKRISGRSSLHTSQRMNRTNNMLLAKRALTHAYFNGFTM